jgi:exodeoxyribonuclease V alpha subunit
VYLAASLPPAPVEPRPTVVTAQPSQSPSPADRALRELRGVVERITYQNPENGFTLARLAPERPEAEAEAARGEDRLVTVVGTLADLTPGEAIVAHGWWRNDAKHGWQFQAVDYRTALPASLQGMKRYLGSDLVEGTSPINVGRARVTVT